MITNPAQYPGARRLEAQRWTNGGSTALGRTPKSWWGFLLVSTKGEPDWDSLTAGGFVGGRLLPHQLVVADEAQSNRSMTWEFAQ